MTAEGRVTVAPGDDLAAAWAIAAEHDWDLRLLPGTHTFDGSGLSGWSTPCVQGAGARRTTINLTAGSRLIDEPNLLESLLIENLTVSGGVGLLRHSRTQANTGQQFQTIRNVELVDYTGTAVDVRSVDFPRWRITDCVFRAANDDTTKGVSFAGLSNGSTLDGCIFQRNRVHFAAAAPQDTALHRCEFFQYEESADPRVSVWVIPSPTGTNAGDGFTVEACKFGSENLSSSDHRILYADAANGWPDLANASDGHVVGHMVHRNKVAGRGEANQPFVYSMTPRTRACIYGPGVFDGTPPSYVVEYSAYDATKREGTVVEPHVHKYAACTRSNDPGLTA